jgi:transposase InsO family protein
MSKAALVVAAVLTEGRSKSEVAREYGVSRRWVHELVRRFQAEGLPGLAPRSRRPHHSPGATPAGVEERIVRKRKWLVDHGLDAGAETIAAHLAREGITAVPAVSTIWRILRRRGFVVPEPHKRPRSSWIRFAAEQPNERWQADTTHWQLADGAEVEILNIEDDHSRLDIDSRARVRFEAADVVTCFRVAFRRHGLPAQVLTDNGAIFTGGPRGGGRVALEVELATHGILANRSTPYHPQTCGKVERFHQTQKKWLAKQPPAATLTELQRQLDRFRRYYNTTRPHRALHRRTPGAYVSRTIGHPAFVRISERSA